MQNNNKITFIIGSMRRGGAERVISILANHYAEKGWQVDILTLLDKCNDYKLNSRINVMPLCEEGMSRIKQLPKWVKKIRKYIKENQPKHIISFIARINIISLISSIGLNQKVVISERNDPKADGRSKLLEILTFLLYPLAKRVVFQTKWAQSCFPLKIQKNSEVIYNPIEVKTKASKEKEKKIVAVGRLEEQKNHELLIKAFEQIYQKHKEYKLFIYGEGSLRYDLENLIASLSVGNAVFLPGNIENIHEEIADSSFFVLSSNYEGLSNAMLEAMTMGIPCISTACAGSSEVIENKKNGILIPVGSLSSLKNSMEMLITNEALRNKIGNEAKNTSSKYEMKTVIEKWEKIIEAPKRKGQ
jgi:GalNAc-alpha-(1->4)-GalNAc-alpha-(1->3)-diNAcBac-PP-undecaprenol alpha-1,4-N-acetyl-D-galactosaminyltransferase